MGIIELKSYTSKIKISLDSFYSILDTTLQILKKDL